MKKTKEPLDQFPTIEIEASATSETIILQTLVTLDTSKADAALALLKKEFGGVIVDCSTPAGLKAAMADRSKLVKLRTKGDAKRLEMNREDMKPINERNAVWKKIEPVLLQLEAPIDTNIKKQQEIDKENARLAAVAEEARKAGIRERIEKIKALLPSSVVMTAAALETRITQIEGAQIGVEFAEFAEDAATVKAEIVQGMKDMLVTKKTQEAEAERVRLANENAARIQGHRERIASIRDWPRLVFGKTSAEIEETLTGYILQEFDSFEELQEEADEAREAAIEAVANMVGTVRLQEENAVELARLKAAQPKVEKTAEESTAPVVEKVRATQTVMLHREAPANAEPAKAALREDAEVVDLPALEARVADPRETETVTITRKEYDDLLEDSELLNALRNAGVDNWDGWDFALDALRGDGE